MGNKNDLSPLDGEKNMMKNKYGGVLAFLALSSLFSFLISNDSYATASISASTSSSNVTLELSPSSTGASSSTNSHTLTVSTDCDKGYRVYTTMSSDSADNKLHLNGQNSNNAATNSISPASGSISNMSSLNDNQWGIRVGAGTTFGNVPMYSAISTKEQSGNPSPLVSTIQSATDQVITITYGAKVNAIMLPGLYSGNVLYTTIMDTSCYTNNIAVNKGTGVESVSGEGEWSVGTTATIGYTMKPGYHFTSWSSNPTTTLTENNVAGSGNTVGSGSATFTVPSTGVTFTANGAANSYTISYELNGGTKVGARDTSGTYTGSIGIGSASKNGYNFKGWATTNDPTAPTYNPDINLSMDMLAGDSGNTNSDGATITLYAMYKPVFDGITTMQEMTEDICFNASVGDKTVLRDTRDDNTYSIIKLQDGKCWMQGDLKIQDATLTPEDSNVQEDFDLPESTTEWGYEYDYDDDTGDYPEEARLNDEARDAIFYNYYAATAGTLYWDDGKGMNYTTDVDICPKGWHIPTGGEDGEWAALHKAYGGDGESTDYNDENYEAIRNLVITDKGLFMGKKGQYSEGLSDGDYDYGKWWSSTTSYWNEAFIASLYDDGDDDIRFYVNDDEGYKWKGHMIRCVSKENINKTIENIAYMQQVTSEIVDNTLIGTEATLWDNRDRKTYTVKKLNDGNLWMTQDLRITSSTNGDRSLTSENTNIPAGISYRLPNSSTDWGTSADIGSTAKLRSSNSTVYYNYSAATAGGSYYGDGYSDEDRNINQDICPKGWHLPRGGAGGQFEELYSHYNYIYGMTNSDGPHFGVDGRFYNGSIELSSTGYYWSSTINGSTNAYRLDVSSSNAYTDMNLQKYYGLTIRCVADGRHDFSNISTMQQMTHSIIENLSIGDSTTLTDSRDNNAYEVKKLPDGNVWMVKNLNIVEKSIDATNSNMEGEASFYIPAPSSGWAKGDVDYGNVSESEIKKARMTVMGEGGLYNYYTATAGNDWFGNTSFTSADVPYDICPKGWRMPTNQEYSNLDISYGGEGTYSRYSPYLNTGGYNGLTNDAKFQFAGKMNEGTVNGYYSEGHYWTSSVFSGTYVNGMSITKSNMLVDPTNTNGNNKYTGQSIRCIAK